MNVIALVGPCILHSVENSDRIMNYSHKMTVKIFGCMNLKGCTFNQTATCTSFCEEINTEAHISSQLIKKKFGLT